MKSYHICKKRILQGNKMDERFMPSLDHIVMVQIATTLWNKEDISKITKINEGDDDYDYDHEWEQIENKVAAKVSLLTLPQLLKEKISGLIKPIGLQILQWWKDYTDSHLAINLPNEFYFTPRGTLDKIRTAKVVMSNETIDIPRLYEMACLHCLQDEIRTLWERMPESCRRSIYDKGKPVNADDYDLVVFWTYDIQGELDKLADYLKWDDMEQCTPYQWAFERALRDANKVAVEYFLNKLNPEEREASLRYALDETLQLVYCWDAADVDTVCFMLSQMNKAQQLELLQRHPYDILRSFLQWPRQCLFRVMVNHMEVFLKNKTYYFVLWNIFDKIRDEYKDYDYQKLFREFWLWSDITRKKYVLKQCANRESYNLLFCLLWNKDIENVSLILKDATVEEKENIVFNKGSYFCFYSLWCCGCKWDTIQVFLSKLISSREKLIKFKDECKKSKWNIGETFFESLDDFIEKWNEKRSQNEKNCSPNKRFCSTSK